MRVHRMTRMTRPDCAVMCNLINTHTHRETMTGTGTRIGSGRTNKRRKSARNRKIVVDAVRETGETRVEREKKCRKERIGSVATNPDNVESNKEAGGVARGTQGSSKNCTTSRESVSPLSRLIRGFRNKYH